jgi:two-component system response regulator (stage 0 sporulation protein A)
MDSFVKTHISGILRDIGVPAHILGYKYISEAVEVAVYDPNAINNITKSIYPHIAKAFSTTPSRVERAIRRAIETAWDRGDAETLRGFFGHTVSSRRGRPTNSEFIAAVSVHLSLQMRLAQDSA